MLLNKIGEKFNSQTLKALNFENFLSFWFCAESKSDYQKLVCLNSKTRQSCLAHDRKMKTCSECNHLCTNAVLQSTAHIFNQFYDERVRFPRFLTIDKKLTYIPAQNKKSELQINDALK